MDVISILVELIKEKYYIGMPSNSNLINKLLEFFSGYRDVQLIPDSEGLNHLLIGLNCQLNNIDNAILLSGHMDTIKPDDSWNIDPHVDNDKIYGLGSTDMKAFFAALIVNKDILLNSEIPIMMSITFDEETLGNGIKAIIEELKKRNINISYALIGEPTRNDIVTSSRGNSVYVIQTIGKSCHSMNPENGINALYPMSHLISYIEELNETYSGLLSLNPVLSDGGKAPNQVCGFANMKLSIRSSNVDMREQVLKKIQSRLKELSEKYHIDTRIFPVFELKAFEQRKSDINDSLLETLDKPEGEYLATTEAGEIQSMGVGDITIIGPGDLALAHKENEFCDISQLLEYSKLLPSILGIVQSKINEKNGGLDRYEKRNKNSI